MHWKCLQRCITSLSSATTNTALYYQQAMHQRLAGQFVWDAVAIKIDCSLPAMSRKHCKRYKMDSEVSNNDPGPARARVIAKNQPFQKITPQVHTLKQSRILPFLAASF
jgi:hypothetical protein